MTNKSKDYTKLKEVSKCFSEETLKNILHNVYKGKSIDVISWDFGETSAKGDNYLSTIYKIKIHGIVDEKEVEVGIVVKSLPSNIGRRKTYRSTDFFSNEIAFYTKVIPNFSKFLEDKGQSQILCIPRYLASIMDGENDFVALEDVTAFGYVPIARQNCLPLDQCKVILKSMARLHGISFAYKDKQKEKFKQISESLHETYFGTEHWNWYKRFMEGLVNIARNAVSTEYPDSEAEKKFLSYDADVLYQKASDLCNRKDESTSVIVQGDSWVPNFMIRKVTEDEALMLDFQLTRCASPVLDLSTFLYACTNETVWNKNFDTLLKFYYDELCNTITLLGSNPDKMYPWITFMKEIQEKFVFGMIFALEIIPMSLLDQSDTFDLDLIKHERAVDIADVWTLSNIKTQAGRLRLANIIVHAVEKGFL